MIVHRSALVLVCGALVGCAQRQADEPRHEAGPEERTSGGLVAEARLIDYGMFVPGAEDVPILDPGSPSGQGVMKSMVTLVRRTDAVPAEVGSRFGIRYVITGTPGVEEVVLRCVTLCPEMTDPETGETFTRYEGVILLGLDPPGNLMMYSIDEEWEAVPGTWSFQVWEDDRRLIEKRFTLTGASP